MTRRAGAFKSEVESTGFSRQVFNASFAAPAHSPHRRAMQIRADGERARVVLFNFGEGRFKIELTDVAEH